MTVINVMNVMNVLVPFIILSMRCIYIKLFKEIMATRRVKTRRTAHHKRGHKTKRHYKRNNRFTKKHKGGMFKAFTKYLSEGWKVKTEKGDSVYDGIQVRVRTTPSGNEYLIANGTLNEYQTKEPQYGEKIQKYIQKANERLLRNNKINIDANAEIILNEPQFEAFANAAAASASAVGSAAIKPNSSNSVLLENGPIGSNTMILHFGPNNYTLQMNEPLEVPIPPNPQSNQNPVQKLIFSGNTDGVRAAFALKKDVMSYCAMSRYDEVNQYKPSQNEELNYEVPSITKNLILRNARTNDITLQIIPMIDNLQKYANKCEQQEFMQAARDYYTSDVRAAHIVQEVRDSILKLFPVGQPGSPLTSQMSAMRL